MRQIINIFAVIVIILAIISMLPISFFPSTSDYFTPVSVILAAIAVIAFEEKIHIKWVKIPQYSIDPSLFVDRYNLVGEALKISKTPKTIINIFGANGIGVTQSLQFIADSVNKKVPFKKRLKYQDFFHAILHSNQKALYLNVSQVTSTEDIVKLFLQEIALVEKVTYNCVGIAQLAFFLNQKDRQRRIVLFDEIGYKGQMRIVEDFCIQYLRYRPNDSFIIGTHQKSLSYQFKFDYLEVVKFDKSELMILAKAYQVNLNDTENVELYELSDGIPMFAYLLLRYYNTNNGLRKDDLIKYISEYIIPSLTPKELDTLSSLCTLGITNPVISIENGVLELSSRMHELEELQSKGLIHLYKNTKISINKILLNQINTLIPVDKELCSKLYEHYIQRENYKAGIAYILLTNFSEKQEKVIEKFIDQKMQESDALSLALALEPSIRYNAEIKSQHPSFYLKYVLACIYMLNMEGKYLNSEKFINQLIIDGILIKRFDKINSSLEFEFYFAWADTEHLLNHYNSAIEIIDQLIANSNINYLPRLYWMKAHCLRHQWAFPAESLHYYQLCEEESIKGNNTEYLIRSLHGQILIAFIEYNAEFDFLNCFSRLDQIYRSNSDMWKQYQYNTYKYKAIFYRQMGDWDNAELFLQKSLQGFLEIRKRNIYDIYFEFGEYYRLKKRYAESIMYYQKSKDFAKGNSDYNLQSLSEMGIILCNTLSTDLIDVGEMQHELMEIASAAQKSELNLNREYAQFIAENILDSDVIGRLCLFNP